MKIVVIELSGEEKLLFSRTPKDTTLGQLLKDHIDNINSVEINNKFIDDWQSHLLKTTDNIKIYPKIEGFFSIIFNILLSFLFQALASLFAPKPKKPNKNLSSQPALGIAGIQNTIAPGTPKFLTYGKRRVFGHLIASKIDVTETVGRPDSGKKMSFSALYFMGVGPICNISNVKINNSNIADIQGPPVAITRVGTSTQTIITGHEFVHQTYRAGLDMEIKARPGTSKSQLPTGGKPITWTTRGNAVERVTFFFHFPQGLFAFGVHGKAYPNFIGVKILRKLNNETVWENTGTFNSIYTSSRDGFFWKLEMDLPSAGQWDFQLNADTQSGHGSFEQAPTMSLFNVMETELITTAYPNNALLEVHGVANDQVTGFDEMETSALVYGRLVDVYENGIYTKQPSRNRVWITRDLLLNKDACLGNRLSSTLWDNASGVDAATYYEGTTLNFDNVLEQRDYCDVIINEARSGWDHIKNLLFEGRAMLIPSGGKFKYVLDIDRDLSTGNYINYAFPGNIIEDTLQLETGSQDKPINTIRAEFADESIDYKVIPAKLVYPGTEDEPEKLETVSFTSITRKSQASREMNFRLKKLRLIKRRWTWKSPRSAIVSEPLDISKLSYNISKNLRGYNGFVKEENSTNNSIITGKEIYLAAGASYSIHVRHGNTVEERAITNALGNTYSILSLAQPLSFYPLVGDIWTVGKTSGQILKVQVDETEFDGESFVLKVHEHIPGVYVDTLTDVTSGENTTPSTAQPQPLLGAQIYRYYNSGTGLTYYQTGVVPGFSTLAGTYSGIGTNTIIVDTKEPNIDDLFNNAYITVDSFPSTVILDYTGQSRSVLVNTTAGITPGNYSIIWSGYSATTGFKLEYGTHQTNYWTEISSITGFSSTESYNVNYETVNILSLTGITPTTFLDAEEKTNYLTGTTFTVYVSGGPGNILDFIEVYDELTNSIVEDQYLNGSSTTPPLIGITTTTLTFIAPITGGTWFIDFWENDGSNLLDTLTLYPTVLSTTESEFRFSPLDANGNNNVLGAWITRLGVTDTTVPTAPFSVDLSTNSAKQGNMSVILNTPAPRDLYKLETNLFLGSITGPSLTLTYLDVSNLRNESDLNGATSFISYDLSNYPINSTFFAEVATLDFYGNKSNYAYSFTGITLSSAEVDTPIELQMEDTLDLVTYTGSTQQTLFTRTIGAGEIGSDNSVELDLQFLVRAGTTQSTTLNLDYLYGGVSAGSFTCNIADGNSRINTDTPYWLNFFISPNGGSATSQSVKIYKWGEEIPANTLRTGNAILSKDSNTDQTMEVMLTISGATTSILTKQRARLKQLIPV